MIEGERLNLVWRERGSDLDPGRMKTSPKGFGSVVLERMLGIAMDAELERRMHADGIEWRISIPLSKLKGEPAKELGERRG